MIITKGKLNYSNPPDDQYYGWDDFVLTEPQDKMHYLAAMIKNTLKDQLDVTQAAAKTITEQLLGITGVEEDSFIDHQSMIDFPKTPKGLLNLTFLDDFKKCLLRNDVVVLGGNDNGDYPELPPGVEGHTIPYTRTSLGSECWTSKSGDWWTLFNPHNGNKFTFSFEENPKPYERALFPELVDIKITDYCPFNCPMCYVGSTLQGKHASLEDIRRIAAMLANQGTFEVAIGGGEPTLHPHFREIVEVFRAHNIVPNVTTRNLPWLKALHQDETLQRLLGGVAFSIDDIETAKKVKEALATPHFYGDRALLLSFQVIMGVFPPEDFKSLVHQCKWSYRLTLLGYKNTGRGSEFSPGPIPENWFEDIEELLYDSYTGVAIDTVFAAQQQKVLRENHIVGQSYSILDSVSSCFIDAVNKTSAPSSYDVEGKHVHPLNLEDPKCLENFKEWWTSLPYKEELEPVSSS